MTRLTPLFTSLKTLEITYPSADETLLATPVTLPTSEPASPQISYTVQQSHFPSFSFPPLQKRHIALLYGAGKFTTAGTVYWRMKKNGGSVHTGSASVGANTFYTISCFFGVDVAVGDVLELALWSNQTDSNWDYKALQVLATRVIPFKPRPYKPCNFAVVSALPNLTLGNPNAYTRVYYIIPEQGIYSEASLPFNCRVLHGGDASGIFQLSYGDRDYVNQGVCWTSATNRPNYYRNHVPTKIVMRGVRID